MLGTILLTILLTIGIIALLSILFVIISWLPFILLDIELTIEKWRRK